MSWFDYLKKTSVVQIATDWKEYKKLKRALGQAEKDMVDTGSVLVRYCDNKQKYNDLKTAYNSYWANKFAHVK